jgi:hypothetical protein
MKTINRRLLLFGSASALLLALALAGNVGGDQTRCPTWADASTRYLEEQLLAGCNCNELDLLANELLARHGRTFSRPDLKDYFGRQPWYKPDPNNTAGNQGLNPFELWNADLLRRYQLASGCRREAGVGSCPIWPATRIGLLSDQELAPCSCRELELLRQEIYARHGKVFDRPDLRAYFTNQFWYVPDGKNPRGERGQNQFEERNISLILAHEQGRRCLAAPPPPGQPCPSWPAPQTRALAAPELDRCSCRELELRRHEISARHGRIFTDPGLFNYFKAQPWYVPDRNNPSGDKGQNVFERENVIVLGEAFRKRGCAEVKPE